MPQMQEVLAGDHESAGAATASAAQRLFQSPGTLIWQRKDWPNPIGSLSTLHTTAKRSSVRGLWFDWNRIDIPELVLERHAAILLLQGQSLSQLLIPNHELVYNGKAFSIAHLILRTDPWQLWQPVPRLTGLVLAQLGELPRGIPPTELLATLAADSAPA